jgi:hypothetical protein
MCVTVLVSAVINIIHSKQLKLMFSALAMELFGSKDDVASLGQYYTGKE